MFLGMNDFELLYLIKDGNEQALDLMFNKYSIFIKKIISEITIYDYDVEDLHQEGLILLNTAIYKYSEMYNKTFFKYFEVILKRRLIYLVNRRNKEKYIIFQNTDKSSFVINDPTNYLYYKEAFDKIKQSDDELVKIIYDCRFVKNYSIKEIEQILGYDRQLIYVKINKIKKILNR